MSDSSERPRIASLLPSATEIVYALGAEPVVTSHECDYPPEAADLPSVVSSRVDDDASSAEIDAQVRDAQRAGAHAGEGVETEASAGVYDVDREALAAADPDVVVTQGLCDVCAVDTVVVESAIQELGLDCELVTTDAHSLQDVFDDVRRIGDAIGREAAADRLVADLRGRVRAVEEAASEAPFRPEVAVLDWMDPVMVAGHWVPELVEMAGGSYGLADPGDASTPREWAEIRAYDPDVLVAAPCGFELEQTFANRSDLTDRDGWRRLRAVRMNRAYAMDGHHLTNRPGPRVVDTLETLAGLVHPDEFDASHEWAVRTFGDSPG